MNEPQETGLKSEKPSKVTKRQFKAQSEEQGDSGDSAKEASTLPAMGDSEEE